MPTKDEVVWSTADPNEAISNSMKIVDHALRHSFHKPPCVVFDVDSTLLVNHGTKDDYFKLHHPGKLLFEYAEAKNLPIFIVTARRKSTWSMKFLKAQLERLGYNTSNIKGVYMVPKAYDHLDDGGAAYKQVARKHIGQDHTILFTAGDRWGDVCNYNHKHPVNKLNQEHYHGLVPSEGHTYLGIKFSEASEY